MNCLPEAAQTWLRTELDTFLIGAMTTYTIVGIVLAVARVREAIKRANEEGE